MGCEANSQFKITPSDSKDVLLMADEHSSCCIRKCCGSIRPWTIAITRDDQPFSKHIRPYACMPGSCKVSDPAGLKGPLQAQSRATGDQR